MDIFLVVIDSFGIGALPDAANYGDETANTAAGIGRALGQVKWPNLQAMGLGNAASLTGELINGCPPSSLPSAQFGAMMEQSPGKDTTTGHWEIAGLILTEPFRVFPPEYPSFPGELIDGFIRETGIKGILGNKSASGTVIIEEFGKEHLETGFPICYTSADSVFQIAAHTDIIPLKELYRLCKTARTLCDSWKVGRVIARPFQGEPGNFHRTKDRYDWSIELPGRTLLNHLQDNSIETVAVGKIGSIFNEQGIDKSFHDSGNPACMARTLELAKTKSEKNRFVFVNLVDTDMIYGHRRDPGGYHDAVASIDQFLPELEKRLKPGDRIAICADHGCDPTFRGTDHTREYVPVLYRSVGSSAQKAEQNSLGIRETFTDLSAQIQREFGLIPAGPGTPFN